MNHRSCCGIRIGDPAVGVGRLRNGHGVVKLQNLGEQAHLRCPPAAYNVPHDDVLRAGTLTAHIAISSVRERSPPYPSSPLESWP